MILAIIQGVAEFLPISSSGHLVVVAAWLAGPESQGQLDVVDVNIFLHFGTLLSILLYYWRRVLRLLTTDRRTILLLMVGTLPAVMIGLPVKRQFEWILESALLAGCLLVVNAVVLWLANSLTPGKGEYNDLSYRRTIGIGLAQAFAILPGISRSGSTISAGLAADLSRSDAATFAFLLAIPAIAGASLLEVIDLMRNQQLHTPLSYLAIGAAVAFAVGLCSLHLLLWLLEKGRLYWFAYWCLAVGGGVILWQLLEG